MKKSMKKSMGILSISNRNYIKTFNPFFEIMFFLTKKRKEF